MNAKFIVAQSNELITARHNNPLTAREQKIILAMVSEIQPDDEDFKEYRISLKDFNDLLGLKGKAKYTQMREIMENMMNKTIKIGLENKGWLLVHWVSSAQYVDGSGVIELTFSPKLKPYLLQLKQYSSYKLSNVLSLNSTYSIRLYEIMKRWSFMVNWECPLEDLKEMIGVQEDTYKQYGHFKNRVLKRAVDEVNEKTDIKIVFEEIKNGRSVEKIKFTILKSIVPEIEPVKKKEQPKKEFENEDVRTRLNALAKGYAFDEMYFAQLYLGASFIWNDDAEKELSMLIHYVNEEESVKNPLGFIKKKLQDCAQLFQEGLPITFANLQSTKRKSGREEKVPDWFNKRENTADVRTEDEKKAFEEERRKLLEELGMQDSQ